MGFLQRSRMQATELFKSMSVGARIQTVLLLTIIIVSCFYMFPADAQQPGEYLFSGRSFRPQELVAIEAALCQAGLGNYEIHGSRVLIPRQRRVEYVAAIADADALPPSFGDLMARVEWTPKF